MNPVYLIDKPFRFFYKTSNFLFRGIFKNIWLIRKYKLPSLIFWNQFSLASRLKKGLDTWLLSRQVSSSTRAVASLSSARSGLQLEGKKLELAKLASQTLQAASFACLLLEVVLCIFCIFQCLFPSQTDNLSSKFNQLFF